LADVGAAQAAARLLEGGAGPLQLDRAARQLAAGSRRLLVVDDLDHGGSEAVEFLAVLAGRLPPAQARWWRPPAPRSAWAASCAWVA
jgi:hypothetical protein